MIDLHAHTTFSDGSLTPTELVEEASAIGLAAVAVTDHDTVDGLPEALAAGERLAIRVVPGVEINLEHARVTMDMLGYFLAGRPNGELQRECAIVDFHHDAFERFLRRGAPAWVDRRRLSLGAAVKLLRASGGLPVLAHPGIIHTDDAGLEHIVRDAARLGVAGLECYYPLHDEATVARCLALARKYALVPTGGSDYHGTVKPDAHLGIGSAGRPLPDRLLADLDCLARDAERRP